MPRTPSSQLRATQSHRRRSAARGLVRLEVQAARHDTALIRAIADTLLQGGVEEADLLRSILREAIDPDTSPQSAFDIFGSDLPDEAFDGVFATERAEKADWRPLDL